MTRIDIFSGFLGAGKTTLIKKLINEAYKGEKLVLIENEFGEIGVDAGFLTEAGVNITEMNSGCICCSLVGDFSEALKKVIDEFNPDRILIEPSGVGKLSDVIKAIKGSVEDAELTAAAVVVDAKKCKMYMKNFGEFFNNQIEHATTIIFSHTKGLDEKKLNAAVELVKEHNKEASLITTDWDEIKGSDILAVIDGSNSLNKELLKLQEEAVCPECGHVHGHHHHEHHHHDEECSCGHHHEHHHHDEECSCGHHHEHHHHDEECSCGHHHEHHHHHADEVFTSFGMEGTRKYTRDEIENILNALNNEEKYGMVIRAKGFVPSENTWIYFDYTPGEPDVREGAPAAAGRFCVIGSKINEEELKALFK